MKYISYIVFLVTRYNVVSVIVGFNQPIADTIFKKAFTVNKRQRHRKILTM